MRCVYCGCDKDAGAFSSAQKKKPVAKRRCISCTAAATGGCGGSVATLTSSAVSAGAAQLQASQGADDTLGSRPSTASTPANGTGGNDAASAEHGDATRACSACGKQLAGTADIPSDWKMCGRCKQAFYCGKACQVEHWKRGGHKLACKAPMACCICLDNDGPPLPVQCGCGCRREAGCAHVACKIAYAKHHGRGYHEGWYECPTCKQDYTGAMLLGLAEALCAKLQRRPAKDYDRLCAQDTLANAYKQAGRFAEAEALYRDILAINRPVHGLVAAANLGSALLGQGKHSDAEAVFRDTLARQRDVLGAEHKSTLLTAGSLASALTSQGKYAEAEPVLRDTLAIQQRVLGRGHDSTLTAATNLAVLLNNTDQSAEAEVLGRSAMAQANRTLGPDHPKSLEIARVLASTLGNQGHVAEADALFSATLATQQRVLGLGHPHTQHTAQALRGFQQRVVMALYDITGRNSDTDGVAYMNATDTTAEQCTTCPSLNEPAPVLPGPLLVLLGSDVSCLPNFP